MRTFDQFVSESAEQGGVNIVFEAAMYSLVNDLERIVKALRDAGVEFEVVGGVAVNAHILALHRSRSFVTRDIDLLVHRSDLPRIAEAAESLGYIARKMMGGYTLIRPEQDLAETLDEAGLITPTLERGLPPAFEERLKEARRQIAENKPDVEG
jgi:hypothetical protein